MNIQLEIIGGVTNFHWSGAKTVKINFEFNSVEEAVATLHQIEQDVNNYIDLLLNPSEEKQLPSSPPPNIVPNLLLNRMHSNHPTVKISHDMALEIAKAQVAAQEEALRKSNSLHPTTTTTTILPSEQIGVDLKPPTTVHETILNPSIIPTDKILTHDEAIKYAKLYIEAQKQAIANGQKNE